MIRGGLRTRLVLDSVRFAVISLLQREGWFDPTVNDVPPGSRRHQPFRYIARPVDWAEDIRPNAIAVSGEDISDEPLAFGGEVQDIVEAYIDIFAEDDALGWQVAYDIRDSLYGKGDQPIGPEIDVYDFRQPTPSPFTVVDLDFIETDRAQGEAQEWQRHWFMLHLVVLDDYDDEAELEPMPITVAQALTLGSAGWDAAELQAWDRIREVEQHVP